MVSDEGSGRGAGGSSDEGSDRSADGGWSGGVGAGTFTATPGERGWTGNSRTEPPIGGHPWEPVAPGAPA
ncbi:hypothetical protein GCM10009818_33860 [Nakamurella flavida]